MLDTKMPISITYVEAEGDKVEKIIKELRLRLFKDPVYDSRKNTKMNYKKDL